LDPLTPSGQAHHLVLACPRRPAPRRCTRVRRARLHRDGSELRAEHGVNLDEPDPDD